MLGFNKQICDMSLSELIDIINEKNNKRALGDDFLESRGSATREQVGIGEYSYGIVTIPVDFILPYLEELQSIKEKSHE